LKFAELVVFARLAKSWLAEFAELAEFARLAGFARLAAK
jgi:hypothetical protein